MTSHASVLGIYAGMAGDAHKLGIDPEKTHGCHTLVCTSKKCTFYLNRGECDVFEIVKVWSNVALDSMTIQGCVTDFSLTNMVGETTCAQEAPFVYTFPWKVEYIGNIHSDKIVVKPVVELEETENVDLVVIFQNKFLANKPRYDVIVNGRQALTTHSYTSTGKQVGHVVSFPLRNYSRTNGLFVHNLCLDDLAKITLTINGAHLVDVAAPYLEEVVKKYTPTSIYIPLNGKMDPRPDDFQGSVHLGCIDTETLTLKFKPHVEVTKEITVQTLDLVFLTMGKTEPSMHPHFTFPTKRNSDELT